MAADAIRVFKSAGLDVAIHHEEPRGVARGVRVLKWRPVAEKPSLRRSVSLRLVLLPPLLQGCLPDPDVLGLPLSLVTKVGVDFVLILSIVEVKPPIVRFVKIQRITAVLLLLLLITVLLH